MKKNIKVLVVIAATVLLSVIGCEKAQAADMTLKNGKWINGTLTKDVTANYYKVSVKKTGYLKIEYVRDSEDAFAGFSVCNGKKKKIWDNKLSMEDDNKATAYFPVKKGTYYICIKDSASSWEDGEDDVVYDENVMEHFKIKYTFTAMKEGKKINKLKDAPLLKKKKQVSGLIFPSKKSRDMCYKYTVSAKTKVKFSYEVFGLWLRIADSKGKYLSFDSKGRIEKRGDSVVWWEGKGSDYVVLPKGTYYFVIQQWDTGYYKLKVK